MKVAVVIWTLVASCVAVPLERESVVSVYTTQPTTAGTTPPLDVYHQLATNIADRITSPIYNFLGITKNKTEDQAPTSRKLRSEIELLDDPEDVTKAMRPIDNDISTLTDVEEVTKKTVTKPEKIAMSFYHNLNRADEKKPEVTTEVAKTTMVQGHHHHHRGNLNASDDDDDLSDFDEDVKPKTNGRDSPFIYILEILGSVVQLAWGAIQSLFMKL